MSAEEKTFSIYQYYQFNSIEGKLLKTDVAFERRVRRWYANELGTSVSKTFDIAWTDIVSHYYDSQIEDTPFNIVFNMAIDEYVPELAEEEEKEQQAFADSLVEEQKETLSKKSLKDENSKKTDSVALPSVKIQEPPATEEEPNDNKDIEMNFDLGNPDED